MQDGMAGASSRRQTEPEMLRSYHQHARCAVACNETSVVCKLQRYSPFITVTRLRIDASSHGETANGARPLARNLSYSCTNLCILCYRIFKYYPPAIYHGQGLARVWLDVAAGARTNIGCSKSEDSVSDGT